MPSDPDSGVAQLRARLNRLKNQLGRSKAKQVKANSILDGSRDIIHHYFNDVREHFTIQGLDDESLGGLDALMQALLRLTHKSATKKVYEQTIKSLPKN